jgi:MFS family permease
MLPASDVAQPGARGTGLRAVLIVLCVTEITSWGVLYYAFPVLAPSIAASTGWSSTAVTAAFSLSLIVAAVAGIPVGRWLDRSGPRAVMTAGSAVAVAAVIGIALATSLVGFALAWAVAGVAMAAVLYQPAFAALTRWYGPSRVSALTALTLVAGLASTVFAPLTGLLVSHLDWRQTYFVLAAVLALITLPAHALGLRRSWPAHAAEHHDDPGPPRTVIRSRAFVMLTVAMSLAAFSVYAVVVNLVPLLIERGMSVSTAAIALGLGGVGQVLGRLGYGRLVRRTGVRTRTVVVVLTAAATTALLAVVPGPTLLLVAATVLVGMARGIFTLLQATAISDRWGAAHYGRLNGLFSAPMTLTAALAPWAGTALAGVFGGYPAVFATLAAAAVVAAALAFGSAPTSKLD